MAHRCGARRRRRTIESGPRPLAPLRGTTATDVGCDYRSFPGKAGKGFLMLTWQDLAGLDAYRIVEIPRRPDADGEQPQPWPHDPDRALRAAALVAAYHASAGPGGGCPGALAVGWVRPGAGTPVQLIAAGHGLAGSRGDREDQEVLLTVPAGARARPLGHGALPALLARLPCWRAIGGISDGLLPDDDSRRGDRAPPSLEECLLAVWPGPFGWLLVAEPLPAAEIGELAAELARRAELASGDSDRFPERAVVARRLRLRHAEVRTAASTGLWRVRLLAGAADAGAASRVAGLVCASADLAGLPYAVAPADGAASLRELLDDQRPAAAGEILDSGRRPAGPLLLPLASLNRHVFVCGATGAGKSQTVRALLEAAGEAGIPWLVVEPAKAEYRLMAGRLAGTGTAAGAAARQVVRIRPGDSDAIAAGLNPLEPAPDAGGRRFPLQTHADLIKALFVASFRSEEPFPQVLSAALTRVYQDAGWDLALGETVTANPNPGYPTLTDLQRAAVRVVREVGYSQRITDDVLGFIKVRLSSLRLGTTGRFLEGGHQIDFGRLLATNAVLEIEDVGDDSDKAFLMGAVLIRLAEHLRMADRAAAAGLRVQAGLRHLTVLEEAHRLLRRPDDGAANGAAAHAVEMFAGLLAEIRAYGEGLVIVEQIPDRLVSDVIKNTAVKIAHRLPAADDRDAVGATMNMTRAQNRFLVTLRPGEAAV